MTENTQSHEQKEIQTASQIVLRLLRPEDAATLYELMQKNRPFLEEAEVYVPIDLEDAQDKIARPTPPNRLDFGILLGSQIIGGIDLVPQTPGRAELIYWIDHDHKGRGYAKEAVKTLAVHSLNTLDYHALRAWVHRDNIPSQKTLENAGFVHQDTNQATGSFGYTLSADNFRDMNGLAP